MRHDLSQNLKLVVGGSLLPSPAPSFRLAGRQAPGLLLFPSLTVQGYQVHTLPCLAFHVGARDLNSALDV